MRESFVVVVGGGGQASSLCEQGDCRSIYRGTIKILSRNIQREKKQILSSRSLCEQGDCREVKIWGKKKILSALVDDAPLFRSPPGRAEWWQ